ncbi:MAG: hypothetical protein AAFO04_12810 [Cyanobacteria bacterium J06592_8]
MFLTRLITDSQGDKPLTPNEQEWLWCPALEPSLGTEEGTGWRETSMGLRFHNSAENLVL